MPLHRRGSQSALVPTQVQVSKDKGSRLLHAIRRATGAPGGALAGQCVACKGEQTELALEDRGGTGVLELSRVGGAQVLPQGARANLAGGARPRQGGASSCGLQATMGARGACAGDGQARPRVTGRRDHRAGEGRGDYPAKAAQRWELQMTGGRSGNARGRRAAGGFSGSTRPECEVGKQTSVRRVSGIRNNESFTTADTICKHPFVRSLAEY